MTKVTVIIPNYNGIKYIKNCLDSLFTQEQETSFCVLVVDNGSEDGSTELVESAYPEVKLIRLSHNTGFCHAVNVGIQAAGTPYVLLLNNDTVVLPGFVGALESTLEKEKKRFSVSARMLQLQDPSRIDDAGDLYCVLGWAFARGKGKAASAFSTPTRIFSACGGAAIYRKSILDKIGLFDENHFAYLEDVDIGYRAQIFGYTNWYEPQAQVIHAGSATSGSRYNAFKCRMAAANSVYLIGKNMPFLQILWNLPFLLAGFAVKACFYAGKKMGTLYLKGLLEGWKRAFSAEGKSRKVPFQWRHLKNYLLIQWQLYVNFFRLI